MRQTIQSLDIFYCIVLKWKTVLQELPIYQIQ
jgi:hypothetical protein